jgi:pantoate--beta-alanine ligase
MIIFKKQQDLRQYLTEQTRNGKVIALVPTMGALHAGHRSLIEKAKESGALVVCSIFINPTQFNDKADFDKYPVSGDADIALLIDAKCDVVFTPSVEEVYPGGSDNISSYDFGALDNIFEGEKRPGHFKGVGQVVGRLLDIVNPQLLYMGQKDYQQCMVIKELLKQTGKDEKIQMIISPTVREADGLAMSSRNTRLTEPQRALAAILYQCLVSIQAKKTSGDFKMVQKQCLDLLSQKGVMPEYVELADASDLTPLDNYDNSRQMVALIAAKLGEVRLIDNLILQD